MRSALFRLSLFLCFTAIAGAVVTMRALENTVGDASPLPFEQGTTMPYTSEQEVNRLNIDTANFGQQSSGTSQSSQSSVFSSSVASVPSDQEIFLRLRAASLSSERSSESSSSARQSMPSWLFTPVPSSAEPTPPQSWNSEPTQSSSI